MSNDDLVERLRKRAEIRRQISTRKSVQEGKPDRIAALLEEAAGEMEQLEVDRDQYMVEWELEKLAHAETKAQLADITGEIDQLLTQFSDRYTAAAARRRHEMTVEVDREIAKDEMRWNSWFLHELKTAIRHAGYKKKDRAR